MKRADAKRQGSHKPEPTQPVVPIVASGPLVSHACACVASSTRVAWDTSASRSSCVWSERLNAIVASMRVDSCVARRSAATLW